MQTYNDSKQKSLETINEKLNQHFNETCTFAPKLEGADNGDDKKRNFVEFLEFQKNHVVKVKEKKEKVYR